MWHEIWEKHKGKMLGIICAIFLSVIYLISGFWDMMVCGFLLLAGCYIGYKIDRDEPWVHISRLISWFKDKEDKFR